MAQDSHLSQRGSKQADEKNMVKQHHRLAIGEKVNGTSNPNGKMSKGPNKIGNNDGKCY